MIGCRPSGFLSKMVCATSVSPFGPIRCAAFILPQALHSGNRVAPRNESVAKSITGVDTKWVNFYLPIETVTKQLPLQPGRRPDCPLAGRLQTPGCYVWPKVSHLFSNHARACVLESHLPCLECGFCRTRSSFCASATTKFRNYEP